MRGDVRDASFPPLLVPRDLSWEESHATAFHGVTGPSVVRLECGGQCAGRSQVASR